MVRTGQKVIETPISKTSHIWWCRIIVLAIQEV
jgi:hypothetical protein